MLPLLPAPWHIVTKQDCAYRRRRRHHRFRAQACRCGGRGDPGPISASAIDVADKRPIVDGRPRLRSVTEATRRRGRDPRPHKARAAGRRNPGRRIWRRTGHERLALGARSGGAERAPSITGRHEWGSLIALESTAARCSAFSTSRPARALCRRKRANTHPHAGRRRPLQAPPARTSPMRSSARRIPTPFSHPAGRSLRCAWRVGCA